MSHIRLPWKTVDATLLVVSAINYIDRWSKSHLNATPLGPCVTLVCWRECQITVLFLWFISLCLCLTSFFPLLLLYLYIWLLFSTSISSCHAAFSFSYIFCFSFLISSSLRINEATDFKDHKIQVASCLISLKVEPSPALSVNLSGAPLIKIVLTHILVRINPETVPVSSHLTHVFICHLLFCVSQSYWENGVIFQLAGTAVGCGTPTLSEERGFACGYSSRIPPYEIYQLYFWCSLM